MTCVIGAHFGQLVDNCVTQACTQHYLIKTKVRNRLGNKNLEAMLQIALEGQMRG
jgi:hypothetical protein